MNLAQWLSFIIVTVDAMCSILLLPAYLQVCMLESCSFYLRGCIFNQYTTQNRHISNHLLESPAKKYLVKVCIVYYMVMRATHSQFKCMWCGVAVVECANLKNSILFMFVYPWGLFEIIHKNAPSLLYSYIHTDSWISKIPPPPLFFFSTGPRMGYGTPLQGWVSDLPVGWGTGPCRRGGLRDPP